MLDDGPCKAHGAQTMSLQGRTVKLPEGASEVAPGCMVGCCSCAHRNHCAAKPLTLRRLPCSVPTKFVTGCDTM